MDNNLMSADEARQLLTTFQRGRERGDAADVWGPLDRLEDALRTVVAREAEVAELRALRDDARLETVEVRAAGMGLLKDAVDVQGELRAELEAARADARDAQDERVLLRAIVAAHPTCAVCGATATRTCSTVSPSDYCDEHAPAGPWSLADLPHAAAVRAWRGAR